MKYKKSEKKNITSRCKCKLWV